MNRRFVSALAIVALTVAALIYSAVNATAKSVVTVNELRSAGEPRSNIRLGARVAEGAIEQIREPKRAIRFQVRDITGSNAEQISVQYEGIMPDTLKVGRDVILEGNFRDNTFEAKNLVTQCPSKYVPPAPGARKEGDTTDAAGTAASQKEYP